VHALDAAAKIGVVTAFTVALFIIPRQSPFVALFALAAAVAATIALSRVPIRAVARGLRAVGLIMVLTIVLNGVALNPAVALVRVGPFAVVGGGLLTGIFFAARILLLVTGTSLLTLTTSPVELTSGLERSLAPLKALRVPVGDLAMTLTIALRFIPTTADEAEGIITAQQARGAVFDQGGPLRRARAYGPVLIPLFYQLFRRADALATAMEARCYRGSEGRTRMNPTRMRAADWTTMLACGAALIAMAVFL
jgi:energy-coupling factor transport system permease protein